VQRIDAGAQARYLVLHLAQRLEHLPQDMGKLLDGLVVTH
jgi:hypothetical protein